MSLIFPSISLNFLNLQSKLQHLLTCNLDSNTCNLDSKPCNLDSNTCNLDSFFENRGVCLNIFKLICGLW